MAITKLNLDRQAEGRVLSLGTTSASGEALLTLNKGTAASSTVVLDVKGSQNIAGDLNLTGDLNIVGSVNTQTVTNTNVKDLTITVNDGGTTPTDDTAGIIVEGTTNTVIGALYYRAASATKWSVGTGASQQDIVGTTATQTLTNKTFTSPIINSPTGIVKGDVGLGNVVNIDTTNAANITSGTLPDARLSSSIARSGSNTDITSVLLNQTGLVVKGATSVGLTIKPNETLTVARTLNIITGDATRTLTFTGDASISGTNTGDQTSVTGNAGTATTLQTARNIFGNSFNGSADITAVIASTYGGTGNGFTKFAGPLTSEKTFTLPNASATILTDNATVTVAQGGTGKSSITSGRLLVGAGTTAPTELAGTTSGDVVTWNGSAWVASAPTGSAAYQRWTTVSGTQDGSNKVFTIGNALATGSEEVIVNGNTLDSGASNDYILSGTTLTFQAGFIAPTSTDKIKVRGTY